jgi:asparagine synthase (glutamine-hydrolysing)
MGTTLGDFLVLVGPPAWPAQLRHRLMDDACWPHADGRSGPTRTSSPARNVHVWSRGDVRIADGTRGGLGLALEPSRGARRSKLADPREAVLTRWSRDRHFEPESLQGRYSYVLWDDDGLEVLSCTDAFRTCALFYAHTPRALIVASDLRLIAKSGVIDARVSLAAVYQYLNFSYIPAPLTAIEGVSKLPAGHRLNLRNGEVDVRRYWAARYPADLDRPEAERVQQLQRRLVDTVLDYRCGDEHGWGTFLSGGTDSSSISGLLAQVHPTPVRSFSIGFAEGGYDELGYSRIASSHYKLQAHEYRVSEADSVAAIPRLSRAFDEPFGNASAIPTFYCADLAAKHGVSLMIAGDGGDEIFGGNERYRKDRIFEWYHRAPGAVHALGTSICNGLNGYDWRLGNRIKNFVRRASLPNPDRFYSDDSFASDHFEDLLDDDFRASVGRDDALDVQRRIYAEADANCDLHRLMYLDLQMTIADNDAVKVVRAAKLAGVQVAFPYLDRRIVDFAGRLPSGDKVRGLNKRHLFKLATQDLLPEAIRNKRKQGFGLPISVWLRRGGAYRDLARDIVSSTRARLRGYFRPEFVQRLIERHERGTWDHAAEIHLLLMLEMWHREFIDSHA